MYQPLRGIPTEFRPHAFLRIHGEGTEPKTMSEDAMQALVAHDWPGNVRDLEMVARDVTVETGGREIALCDLPSWVPRPPAGSLAGVRPLEVVRRKYFLEVVRTLGHVGRAAKALGVSERTVHRVLADIKARAMAGVERIIPERDVLAAYVAEVIKLAQGNRTKAAAALGIAFATLVKHEARARQVGVKWQNLCQTLKLAKALNSDMTGPGTESHALRGPSSESDRNRDRT